MFQQSSRSFPSAGALSAASTNSGSVPRPDLGSEPLVLGTGGQSCPVAHLSSTSARTETFQCNCEIIEWEFNRHWLHGAREAAINDLVSVLSALKTAPWFRNQQLLSPHAADLGSQCLVFVLPRHPNAAPAPLAPQAALAMVPSLPQRESGLWLHTSTCLWAVMLVMICYSHFGSTQNCSSSLLSPKTLTYIALLNSFSTLRLQVCRSESEHREEPLLSHLGMVINDPEKTVIRSVLLRDRPELMRWWLFL